MLLSERKACGYRRILLEAAEYILAQDQKLLFTLAYLGTLIRLEETNSSLLSGLLLTKLKELDV